MKILHITQNDTNGAGVAALRIVQAQRREGLDAQLIVRDKYTSHDYVHPFYFYKYADFLIYKIMHLFGGDYLFSLNSLKIIKSDLFQQADVIHIHNIHYTRMLHPWQLPKSKNYVYTLHDMWAITGFCNYTFNKCERFLNGCFECPLNAEAKNYGFRKMIVDTSKFNWHLKRRIYNKLNIIFTAPSNWLTDLTSASKITSSKEVLLVPNCLESERVIPVNVRSEVLKLLFVGQKLVQNDRKGFDYIVEVCNKLDVAHQMDIVGKVSPGVTERFTNPLTDLKFHNSLSYEALKIMYGNADILLLPTQQDNLPNTILESFAQGTPVVAFDIGGVGDLVSSKTGYLARYQSSEDIVVGIKHVWADIDNISEFVVKFSKNYSYSNIARKFNEVYFKLVKNRL